MYENTKILKRKGLMANGYRLKAQRGFTLVELLVYTALTAMIVGLFGAILITITRIQGQQSGSVEISRELNFLVNAIAQKAKSAQSLDVPESDELLLTYSTGQVTIGLASSTVYIKEGAAAAVDLSSSNLLIDDLVFTEIYSSSNPSSTAVFISLTASTISNTPQNQVTRTIQTSVAPLLLAQ